MSRRVTLRAVCFGTRWCGGNFNRALAYDVRLTVEMKDDAERVGGWDDEEEGAGSCARRKAALYAR